MFSRASAVAFAALLAACSDSGPLDGQCNSSADCQSGMLCVRNACVSSKPATSCVRDDQCSANEFCDADGTCQARAAVDATMTTAPDALPGPIDAEAPDASVAPEDDATTPVFDDAAGPVNDDAAPGPMDAAPGPMDATAGFPDAAPTFPDAAPVFPDAAPVGRDATPAPDAGMSCTTDPQCGAPARVCVNSACVPGCGQAGGLTCSGATPRCNTGTGRCEACNLDADCGNANQICLNRACVTRCDRPGAPACAANTVCNSADGRCIPGNLGLGVDCSLDEQCASRTCLGLQIGATPRNICATGCSRGNDCPLNFGCLYLSGMNFCLSESLFTPPAAYDTRAGGSCSSTNITCQSGWCNTQAMSCIETCSREQDCSAFGGRCYTYTQTPAGGNTYDNLCLTEPGAAIGAICANNAACSSGVCDRYEGRCAAHCCRDADCAASESCSIYDLDTATGDITKICVPRTPGAGTQPIGATCTSFADCESEVCGPVSTAAGAASQCSTLCCNDADCSIFPNGRCLPLGGPTVGTVQTIVGICVPAP